MSRVHSEVLQPLVVILLQRLTVLETGKEVLERRLLTGLLGVYVPRVLTLERVNEVY